MEFKLWAILFQIAEMVALSLCRRSVGSYKAGFCSTNFIKYSLNILPRHPKAFYDWWLSESHWVATLCDSVRMSRVGLSQSWANQKRCESSRDWILSLPLFFVIKREWNIKWLKVYFKKFFFQRTINVEYKNYDYKISFKLTLISWLIKRLWAWESDSCG